MSGPNPRPVIGELPEQVRPDVRWYTVREWRPESAEMDVEVVLHPAGEVDEGPGARWVRRARPGDEVAVQTGTTCYHPPREARVQVVAGDETAYPAIAGILEAARGQGGDAPELHVLLELEATGVVPEQELAASVRRHLVKDRGVPRTSVYFCAYWIEGRPRG